MVNDKVLLSSTIIILHRINHCVECLTRTHNLGTDRLTWIEVPSSSTAWLCTPFNSATIDSSFALNVSAIGANSAFKSASASWALTLCPVHRQIKCDPRLSIWPFRAGDLLFCNNLVVASSVPQALLLLHCYELQTNGPKIPPMPKIHRASPSEDSFLHQLLNVLWSRSTCSCFKQSAPFHQWNNR